MEGIGESLDVAIPKQDEFAIVVGSSCGICTCTFVQILGFKLPFPEREKGEEKEERGRRPGFVSRNVAIDGVSGGGKRTPLVKRNLAVDIFSLSLS